jgi:hypothetical protein
MRFPIVLRLTMNVPFLFFPLMCVNPSDSTVSVTAGPDPLQFVAVTPCRLVDTRQTGGPIQGGNTRTFPVQQEGGCNIPADAAAYSLNVSVVPQGPLGYLTIWPAGQSQPGVATLNSLDGRIKADAAIVPAGVSGTVNVYVTNDTDLIIDINGYFAPAGYGRTVALCGDALPGHRHPPPWQRSALQRDPESSGGCGG